MRIVDTWKSMFEPKILARGRQYWQQGYVTDLSCTENEIHATVLGSDEYKVSIELDGRRILDAYCTCPYAECANCKHMAAVLYAVTEGDASKKKSAAPANASWQEILKCMTAEQMRSFLQCVLPDSTSLQEQLLLGYGKSSQKETTQDDWEAQLKHIVRRCRCGRGYVNYESMEDFVCALDDFVTERLPILLFTGRVMSAFTMVCAVLETASKEDVEEYDEWDDLWDTCMDAWRQILDATDQAQREEMHNWFYNAVKTKKYEFADIPFLLFSDDWDEAHLQKNLELLQALLKRDSNSKINVMKWLDYSKTTMEALHKTEAEIDAFRQQYLSYDFVRDHMLKRFLVAEEYEKAIALLKKEDQFAPKDSERLQHSSEELIRLYGLTGQKQEYRQELVHQLETYRQQNLTHVRELHSVLSEDEWEDWKEKLLDMPTTASIHYQLLAYTEQWSKLFVEIQKEHSFPLLMNYIEPLMKWDAECTLYCGLDFLEAEVDAAHDRNAYKAIVQQLASLSQYPGGKEAVKQRVAAWKEKYARRSALMDELNRAQSIGVI